MAPFEHTLVREVGVRPAIAFAWLTDYREDDPRWVFGDAQATRSCAHLDAATMRVRTVARFAGARTTMDFVVRLAPPDSWRAEGDLTAYGLCLLRQETSWRVEPRGGDGTRLTARFVLKPASLVGRLVLALFGRRIRRELEATYDRIATAIATTPRLAPVPLVEPAFGVGEEPA